MAVDFGMKLGFPSDSLIVALLLVQFIGFPAAVAFGRLGDRLGTRRAIFLALAVYVAVTCWAYFLGSVTKFYLMAAAIGCVQGGIQSLSRSYYARLIPAEKAGEFFGFYNMLSKFAAVLGPAVVGVTAQLTANPRLAGSCWRKSRKLAAGRKVLRVPRRDGAVEGLDTLEVCGIVRAGHQHQPRADDLARVVQVGADDGHLRALRHQVESALPLFHTAAGAFGSQANQKLRVRTEGLHGLRNHTARRRAIQRDKTHVAQEAAQRWPEHTVLGEHVEAQPHGADREDAVVAVPVGSVRCADHDELGLVRQLHVQAPTSEAQQAQPQPLQEWMVAARHACADADIVASEFGGIHMGFYAQADS